MSYSCFKCCKEQFPYSLEQKCTRRSYKVSALLFICPIWQQLSKTKKKLQSLWSITPINNWTRTRTLHISLWHQYQLNAFDRSTDVDCYSWEGRKIKYIHVLQTCERAIDFRWSLPPNSFLSFFVLKQTQTKQIVCFVSFKVLHQILSYLIDFSMIETLGFFHWFSNGVPIIVFNEQSILMLRMTHSLIPMWNELEANQ